MIGETRVLRTGMQSALSLLFPPQCIQCGELTVSNFGLCSSCWRETPFITGLVCDRCGTPLPGEDDGGPEYCDDCMTLSRPWQRGRAALLYKDKGRQIVLALKHGDRLDLAVPAGEWMARAAAPIVRPDMVVVPVPLHWRRLFRRKFNQSALLARRIARQIRLEFCPDALIRPRMTASQDGRNRDERFVNLAGAITPHPRRIAKLCGRDVLLVDDVMTSGATLADATRACLSAGARSVCILVLARVAKDA